mgnify:CR=1 FL=1
MFSDNFFKKVEKKTNVNKETILSLADKLQKGNMKDETTLKEVINDLAKRTGREVSNEKEEKIMKAIRFVQTTSLTPYKIAQDTKITEATIGNYKNGKTKPTLANAEILIRYFEGEKTPPIDTPSISFTKGVPYYNIDFICGFDLVLNDQTTKPEYLIDFRKYNDATCWCNVTGHSMEPEINHGDIIALKKIEDPSFLPLGEVYAIVTTNDMRTIKRLGKGDDKEHYNLIPTNKSPEYGVQEIPKKMIRTIFQVLGCMKRL